MKEFVKEILSDFEDAPRPNTDITGSIFILNETKNKLASNFLYRYSKAGFMLGMQIVFLLLTLITIIGGIYAALEVNSFLNSIDKITTLTNSPKSTEEVMGYIETTRLILYILFSLLAAFFYFISRIFRRSRKRIFLLQSVCENIDQVVVNLKAVNTNKN